MKLTIKIIGVEGLEMTTPFDGQYLADYDTSVEDEQGYGKIITTPTLAAAKFFPDHETAVAFYRQQSRTLPIRPDGKPNRPLTAFTVEIGQVFCTGQHQRRSAFFS